jgi:FAD synthase
MNDKVTSIVIQSNGKTITNNLKFYSIEDTIEYLANLGFNYMYLLRKFDEKETRIELKTFTDTILVLFFKELVIDLFEDFGYNENNEIYYIDVEKATGESDYNTNLMYLITDKEEVFRINLDTNTLIKSTITVDNRVRIANIRVNVNKVRVNYLATRYKFGTFTRKEVYKNGK